MELVIAEGAMLDEIAEQTYAVWNEGLSPASHRRWNDAQMRTPWGRGHLQRLALVDGAGRLLASAKRYRLPVRLHGRSGTMVGIGAVCTAPALRGRGYASRLIDLLLDRGRQEGALLAGLFSEIGSRFYERLGFTTVPIDEVTVRVAHKDGAPAMLVRAADDRDLPALAAMHQVRTAAAGFTLERDTPLVHYAVAKKRLLAGLGPPGLRQVELVVAEEGASAVAYVLLHENANGWTLEEAGDRDPAAARLGGMLQVLLAREPSRAAPLIRAWWPRAMAVPPQVTLADRTDARDLFMVKPLADGVVLPAADDVFYWRSDCF